MSDFILNIRLRNDEFCNGCPILDYNPYYKNFECSVTGHAFPTVDKCNFGRPESCPLKKPE